MKKLLTLLIILLSYSFVQSQAKILIDGSGSMKGFANSNSISHVVRNLTKKLLENNISSEISIFINQSNSQYHELNSDLTMLSDPTNFSGALTLLDQSFNKNESNDVFIIITDNVYDDDKSLGANATLNFYKAIYNSTVVKQIDVVPLSIDFNGNPYCGDSINYSGKRGLLCYLFLTNNSVQKKYKKFLSSMSTNYDVLHIYPINSDHIAITANKNKENNFVIAKDRTGFSIERKNNTSETTLFSNQRNEINFNIGIKSKYQHVIIKEGTKLELDDLRVDKKPYIKIVAINPEISPNKLSDELSLSSQTQFFNCRFILEPKMSSFDDFMLIFAKEPIILSFNLKFDTKKSGLKLDKSIQSKYFSSKYNSYDKIFIPKDFDFLSYFNTNTSKISLKFQNQGYEAKPETIILVGSENEIMYSIMFALFLIIFVVVIYSGYMYFFKSDLECEFCINDDIKSYTLKRFSSINIASNPFRISYAIFPTLEITNDKWFLDDGTCNSKTRLYLDKEYSLLSETKEIVIIIKKK